MSRVSALERQMEAITMKTKNQPHTPLLNCGCQTTGRKNEVWLCSLHKAAPDLLEAAKEALEVLESYEENRHIPRFTSSRKEHLYAAIARAEGGR